MSLRKIKIAPCQVNGRVFVLQLKSTFATKLKASKPTGVTDAQIDLLLSSY